MTVAGSFFQKRHGFKPDFAGIRLNEAFEVKEKGGCERRKGSLKELVKGTCIVNSRKRSNTTAALHPPTLSLDESFSIHHKGRGILGMANKSRHRNSLQFHITFQPAPHLDKKYIAQARKPYGKTEEAARASPGPKVTNSWPQSSVSAEGGP